MGRALCRDSQGDSSCPGVLVDQQGSASIQHLVILELLHQLPAQPGHGGDHPWRTAMWVCRELGSTVTHLGHTRNHPRPPPTPEWHLLMIKVPVVYNYQFDKFTSFLLIIIISFHSARMQEFNNNINNGRTIIKN